MALTEKKVGDRELARLVQGLVSTSSLRGGGSRSQEGCALGIAIGLRAVDKSMPQGSLREERRRKLEYYCGNEPFRGLFVAGTVTAMDFSGVVFSQCYFDQVVWARCRFDEGTIFENCRFVGGDAFNCRGFGLASLANTALDPSARAWIAAVQVREGRRQYAAGDLESDVRTILDKFVGKGGLGLRTVARRNLSTGPIQMSPHRDDILKELVGSIIEEHTISGSASVGYHVAEAAVPAVRFYMENNVFTGPIKVAYERLLRRLNLA